VKHGDAIEKYPDRYMIVTNGHVEDREIHGDILALLTKEEYAALDKPKSLTPKFGFWLGAALMEEEVNNWLGFSV
jgi:hypothetical protein